MINLLLGTHDNPTLRAVAAFLSKTSRHPVVWIDGAALVESVRINDLVDPDFGASICWHWGHYEITPSTTSGVFNLLYSLEHELFHNVIIEDREYARAEWTAYLRFALAQFPNIINPPWGGSLSGACNSLPYQWELVALHMRAVAVPKAFFGHVDHLPEHFTSSRTIVSATIWNGKLWQPGLPNNLSPTDHYLFYERPPGVLLLITILDGTFWFRGISAKPSAQLSADLQSLCTFLMEHFHLRLATVVLFQNDGSYTFGSITPGADLQCLPVPGMGTFLEALAAAMEE